MRFRSRRLPALALGVLLLVLAGCSGGGGSGSKTVTLTLWSWLPNFQDEVTLFQNAHPNIKVRLVNAGQGTPQYTKLRTALKANSGAPDVVQIEFQYLPTFSTPGYLVDLTPYGANDLKDQYADWTWSQVSQGGKVYAIPWDSGPMGLLYRKDIFDRYKLKVPTTWQEFADQARKLHQANPKVYLTDMPLNEPGMLLGLLWQAGARPFSVDGTNVTISMNTPEVTKVLEFWGGLIKEGVVASQPDFTNDWYAGLSKGTYASWITAAWGPVFLQGQAANTSGKWRAAPMPQWSPTDNASANWGGSTLAVTKQSKHPKEAAQLAMWLMSDQAPTKTYVTKQFLFPTQRPILDSAWFADQTYQFYGGQKVNQVFIEASKHVTTDFQWSPFQDYVFSQMTDLLGQASQGKLGYGDVPKKLQDVLVNYANSQGFKAAGA